MPRLAMFALYERRSGLSAHNVRTLALVKWFGMCELPLMQAAPKYSELVAQVGISRGYASDIATGIVTPSRALAIRIYRKTGWKPSNISSLTEADIDVLERVEARG